MARRIANYRYDRYLSPWSSAGTQACAGRQTRRHQPAAPGAKITARREITASAKKTGSRVQAVINGASAGFGADWRH